MLGKIRRIHFIGIGGAGMSGIAELLLNLGFSVSGSDLKETPVTARLAKLGAKIFAGHRKENVLAAEVVVASSAVPPENPEVVEAKRLGIPVIPRAEMLAELMRLKFSVAVAGAHGKTTVTSMIAVMLTEAGLDPTAVIGGRLDAFGSGARLGKGEILVAEADESDRSFLLLLPSIAVVTNIDREHLDCYRDLDEIKEAFLSFMNSVPFYGAVIACADAPWRETLESIRPRLHRKLITYALDPGASVTAAKIEPQALGVRFVVEQAGKSQFPVDLAVPGRHNVQNALAAVCVGLELGLTAEQIQSGLHRFRGADRRFSIKAEADGITIVDDYGHHPTEIRATLAAARASGARRIWAIFQPHRYTRTKFLMDDFGPAFAGCERVYVLDIYPASELPIPGVTAERLVERMKEQNPSVSFRYAGADTNWIDEVLGAAEPGVMIITIGAGSVWKVGDVLADSLRAGLPVKM